MSDKHYTHQGNETQLELALRRLKPWFEANATFLIYGLAAVLAVAAAIVWVRRQPDENTGVSTLWMNAQTPEDYQDIADQNEDTALGRLARLKQADSLLNSASRKMFTDRAAANQELEQVDAALHRLVDTDGLDEIVRERVLLGLARLSEIRCNGTEESVQAAGKAWQDVLDHNVGSISKDLAERRIAELKKPNAATFYAWFHALEPQPADDLTAPGFPGSSFGPGSSVPDVPADGSFPNLDLPILDGLRLDDPAEPGDDNTAPTEEAVSPAAEETSDDAKSLVTEEPATEEPATEEPATEEPATEEPATEEPATEEPATEEPATEELEDTDPDVGE